MPGEEFRELHKLLWSATIEHQQNEHVMHILLIFIDMNVTFCVHSPVKTLICAPTKLSFERRAHSPRTAFFVTCSKTAFQWQMNMCEILWNTLTKFSELKW